jgi:hypothetical protein
MGLQVVPAYIGEALFANPVENDRNILKSMFRRTGLVKPGDFKVTPTGTARQVSVAAGAAFLLGTESTTQGGYHVWSDAADTYTFAAAVGNPRIDTLALRAIDEQYGSDPGISRTEIEIVQGLAAASPVARADSYFSTANPAYKPGAWYRLADVRVNVVDGILPAGQITETFQYVTIGGRTLCLSTARPSSPVLADRIYETNTGLNRQWDGTNWVLIPTVIYQNTLSGSTASITITIPSSVKSFRIAWTARGDNAVQAQYFEARVNGDTGANYGWETSQANNATMSATSGTAQTFAMAGLLLGASAAAGAFASGTIDFVGWDSPHANNLGYTFSSQALGTGVGNYFANTGGGLYGGGVAYTTVTLLPQSGNFVTGSSFTVTAMS